MRCCVVEILNVFLSFVNNNNQNINRMTTFLVFAIKKSVNKVIQKFRREEVILIHIN